MHITVKVVTTDSAVTALSVVIAVTLMCTSLSQHCHYHEVPTIKNGKDVFIYFLTLNIVKTTWIEKMFLKVAE